MRDGTVAALAGVALLMAGSSCSGEPHPRDEAISVGTYYLNAHRDIIFSEHEEPPPGFDFGELFGEAGGATPSVPSSPSLSGGGTGGPTLGGGGTSQPQLGGGTGSPELSGGGVGAPTGLGPDPGFAQAICDFVGSICLFVSRCGGDAEIASACVEFTGSQCPQRVSQALAQADIIFVPAVVIDWLQCSANAINGASCGAGETAIQNSLEECLPISLGSTQ